MDDEDSEFGELSDTVFWAPVGTPLPDDPELLSAAWEPLGLAKRIMFDVTRLADSEVWTPTSGHSWVSVSYGDWHPETYRFMFKVSGAGKRERKRLDSELIEVAKGYRRDVRRRQREAIGIREEVSVSGSG